MRKATTRTEWLAGPFDCDWDQASGSRTTFANAIIENHDWIPGFESQSQYGSFAPAQIRSEREGRRTGRHADADPGQAINVGHVPTGRLAVCQFLRHRWWNTHETAG